MKKSVKLLLDNGTIKVTSQRDDYHEVDMVGVCLTEEEADEEYASADEYFSSNEDLFSRNDFLMTDYVEEGVNVMVPCLVHPLILKWSIIASQLSPHW